MESAQTRVMKSIPIGLLRSSVYQPRKVFDNTQIERLTNSIKSHGLLAPIIAREVGEYFEVLAGQRRVLAAQKAGWDAVDALVVNVPQAEAALLALVENLHRVDLNPVEQAMAFQKLTEEPLKMTPAQIAEMVSLDRSVVARMISYLGEASPIQTLLASGRITGYHLRALKPVTDSAKRVELAQQAAEGKWSATELRKRVAEIVPPKPSRRNTNAPRNDTAPHPVALPRALLMLVLGSISAWAAGFVPWQFLAETMRWVGILLVGAGVFKLIESFKANRERWLSAVIHGHAFARVSQGVSHAASRLTQAVRKRMGALKSRLEARAKARAASRAKKEAELWALAGLDVPVRTDRETPEVPVQPERHANGDATRMLCLTLAVGCAALSTASFA